MNQVLPWTIVSAIVPHLHSQDSLSAQPKQTAVVSPVVTIYDN